MITKTSQNWLAGNVVSVGFMRLTVVSALISGAYVLAAKTKLYTFTPYNGLETITEEQAVWLIHESKRAADRLASQALERIQDQARIASFISKHSEVTA